MSKKEKVTLVPKLRFQEYKNASEWSKVKIGKYLKESRIKGSKGNTAKKLTVKLWGQGVREKNEIQKGSENTQYFQRQAGQFIYSKLDFLNQAFGIVPDYLNGYESTVDLPCFDVDEGLDARFLLEYVKRTIFYKKYGEMADGGRIAKRIQVDTFLGFPVYIPDIKEQQKIADCLSSLYDLITAEDKKLSALRAHKEGLMQKLFPAEGKTLPEWRFPEFRDCREWEETTLERVADYENGKAHENDILERGKYIVVNSKFISTDGEVKKYTDTANLLAQKGDILMVLSDVPNGRAIAKCYLVDKNDTYTVNQRICRLTPRNVNGSLLYYAINRNSYFLAFDDGVKQTNLKKDDVLSCLVTLPKEKQEQQKIADCLSSVDELIAAQAEKIEALKTHKKGLIQGLFPSIEEVGK
ncbi:hypothetical protein GRF59_10410 [Paenibacillus sp. HJL G12]|uniref:Type I restriction modification DNA specificity domain-containing protein n=1 Tax=Paenibacillus dendrobii TaxID=2691084 RepID=A0A7X3LFU2_9BACL|nr:restriction endonuclease subunit S [Paenibacillus dendrobii]MWV44046.1 hypothetical protein [Paenibacillus dendrobii]